MDSLNSRWRGVAFLLAAMATTPAIAQDETKEAAGPFDVELTLTGVSDYRFRGISLNDKDPAFQPQIAITHESGFYGRAWASNIAPNPGADIEVDLVGGWAKEFGKVSLDIGATYYLYPGFGSTNYVEFIGTASTAVGPGTIGVTLAYTPKQNSIGGQDNIYGAINGSLPIKGTPLTLTGSFGIEDGAFGDKKKDWSAGVTADVKGFTLGLAYVDTARTGGNSLGKATAVFSVSRTF
jgi:uncharacterized protein (TIGR02001 family)